MAKRIKAIEHDLEGLLVYQRESDGYVNATQICKVNREITGERRDPNDILKTKAMQQAIKKLSTVTNIFVTDLVETKSGGKYQGTWIHPRLAVRFTMQVNDDFSLAVEDWIHQWMGSATNPAQLEADKDRVAIRDELKNSRRTALTEQVKLFLESVGQYNPGSKDTNIFFGKVHNEINILLTTEKAVEMRLRLEQYLDKEISEKELLRDYYPIVDLSNFAAVCQASANNIEQGMHPINAVRLAVKQVMPSNYDPTPIDFTERIDLVRQRIEQSQRQDRLPGF
ncbi:MAG: KilA-N domain-containing protein [Cyanobacteria bacterium P01_C01_bin.72]